ncbi:MAG: hypothetical protein QXS38_00255 [Candidatus Pacearchaeota archaeon]
MREPIIKVTIRKGMTLREYLCLGDMDPKICPYFRSNMHLNSERQGFYKLAQKPSSIDDNLLSIFPASDEKGKNEQREPVNVLLRQHLNDLIVNITHPRLKEF